MDTDKIDFRDQEEAAEEALSLTDLPVVTSEDSPNFHSSSSTRRSSSQPTDFFEFFSDHSSEMSHAEDIIFCGKLKPFNIEQSLSNQTHKPTLITNTDEKKLQSLHHRRSESMCELKTSRCNTRSVDDYKKLRRHSSLTSETSEMNRNSSSKSSVKSDISAAKKISRPRWYVLMFGLVKFPPEMDLRDIKNRQVRRNPAALVPASRKVPVNRKSSWGLLRILSCKGHASVAVTASFGIGCMPRV